jgi:hypothetical protein
MRHRLIAATCLTLALAGCGGRTALKPAEGQAPPATPFGAKAPPTAQELMQPSTQARPERNAELLKKSQERPEDPFDLPPEGDE